MLPITPEGLIVDVAQVRWVDQILIKSLLVAIPIMLHSPEEKVCVEKRDQVQL